MAEQVVRTELGLEDRGKLWRAVDPDWIYYAWNYSHWRAYAGNPRSRRPISSCAATTQTGDGILHRTSGLVEVPNA